MSFFEFFWDVNQESRINELEEKVEILKEWVDYLKKRLERLEAPGKNFESLNPAPENKKLEKRV